MTEARLAVIGHPIAHSLSPRLHTAALSAAAKPGSYVAFDVRPDSLGDAVRGMAALGFLGANVTIPHKEAVRSYCDRLDGGAAAVGAVNTLKFTETGIQGYNTDVGGFLAALGSGIPGWSPAGRAALILGAGGAARAVAFALQGAGAGRIGIANRTADRAAALVAAVGGDPNLRPEDADLLVNCTSVGMGSEESPFADWERLRPGAVVCDLVYRPAETALLATARARGHSTVGGLGMLAHQAALAWRIWFDEDPPLAAFLAAAHG